MSAYMITKRKYGTSLLFHKDGVSDIVKDNKWEVVRSHSDALGYSLTFDEEDSIYKDDIRVDNTALVIKDYDSYLYHKEEISIEGGSYSLGMYLSFSDDAIISFYNNPNLVIPILSWEDIDGMKCSITLTRVEGTNDACITVTIGKNRKDARFYNGLEANTWIHFMYKRSVDTDNLYIDGKKVLQSKINLLMSNSSTFKEIKLGNSNPANVNSPVIYTIDDFFICNCGLYKEDFEPPRAYMHMLFPEVEKLDEIYSSNDDDHKFDNDHKIGASSGMYYKYHELEKTDTPGLYKFDSIGSGMLFLNSVFMNTDRWESRKDNRDPKSPKTFVTLLNSDDIEVMTKYGGKLVFAEICQTKGGLELAGSDYTLIVDQIPVELPHQMEFKVPIPAKNRDAMDTFILFDGSLAAIQNHRYEYIKRGDERYIKFTNRYDYVCSNGEPLTIVYLKRNTYIDPKTMQDRNVNPQIYFNRLHCVVTEPNKCNIPRFIGKNYGRTGFGPETSLFFVNGTWMHPESFVIKDNVISMSIPNKDNTLLAIGSDITILTLSSTQSVHHGNIYGGEYVVRGISDYDDITSVGITRPSYYKKEEGADYMMYHKHKFYDNNQIPKSNFPTIDKLHLTYKE